jgi:hypothetical protein
LTVPAEMWTVQHTHAISKRSPCSNLFSQLLKCFTENMADETTLHFCYNEFKHNLLNQFLIQRVS